MAFNKMNFIQNLKAGRYKFEGAKRILTENRPDFSDEEYSYCLTLINIMQMDEIERETDPIPHPLIDALPNGWIRDYVNYFKNSESPKIYHAACGIALFSAGLRRRCWRSLGGDSRIYPPISVFLVGPAGSTRKGQAVAPAADFAMDFGLDILQDVFTAESLLEAMADTPDQLLLVNEEAANLFNKKDYMVGLDSTLCRLLDHPRKIEKKLTKKHFIIDNPTANFILAAAPVWLAEMPDSVTAGGLFSRSLLIYASNKERSIPFPEHLSHDEGARELLVAQYKNLQRNAPTGQLDWSPEAMPIWDDFYKQTEYQAKAADDKLRPWFSRKAAHLNRLLMTFMAAAGQGDLIVQRDMLEDCIDIIQIFEAELEKIYGSFSMPAQGKPRYRILEWLSNRPGWQPENECHRSLNWMWDNKNFFRRDLKELVDMGYVEERMGGPTKRKKMIRALKKVI